MNKAKQQRIWDAWKQASNNLDSAKVELAQAQAEDVAINVLKSNLVQTQVGQGATIALNERKIATAQACIAEYESAIATAQHATEAAAQAIVDAEQTRASRIAEAQAAVTAAEAGEQEAFAAMQAATAA